MLKYNKLSKKPESKTGFITTEGAPLFGCETLYILSPQYVHSKSPILSLVSQKGKHISGLFKACNGALIGDFQKKGLVVFLRAEGLVFDVFLSDLPPVVLQARLCAGEMNEELQKARQAAVNAIQ